MGGQGSGGAGKLSAEAHRQRGNWRADRHGPRPVEDPVELGVRTDGNGERIRTMQTLSTEEREQLLDGLPPVAWDIAWRLAEVYWNWCPAAQMTLRAYALSCERLTRLQEREDVDLAQLHAEIRSYCALAAALRLG